MTIAHLFAQRLVLRRTSHKLLGINTVRVVGVLSGDVGCEDSRVRRRSIFVEVFGRSVAWGSGVAAAYGGGKSRLEIFAADTRRDNVHRVLELLEVPAPPR